MNRRNSWIDGRLRDICSLSSRPSPDRRSLQRRRVARIEQLEARDVLSGFSYADFSDTSSLNLVGAASETIDDRLRLTPATGGQSGAAWYATEKQFVGHEFSTTFQFQMTEPASGGSDGFAFIIQNTDPTFLSGNGGTMGYYQLANSLVVEFDTSQNVEANDPSDSHISVHTNGAGLNNWHESLSIASYSTAPLQLNDAIVHTAQIHYANGTLAVYLDDMQTAKLSVSVELPDILALDAGRAWLGFTAATNIGSQNHDILNWHFNATIPATTLDINDNAQIENASDQASVVFTVTRSGDISSTAQVLWQTVDGIASAASGDYAAASGALTFAPGETAKAIVIGIEGDTLLEPHETFSVQLSNVSGASLIDHTGIGTILNDDVAVSINDATASEAATGFQFRDVFVHPNSGGLSRAGGVLTGPDGNLYVASRDNDTVLRYDGVTGAFLGRIILSGTENLDHPSAMAFGPDNALYVTGLWSNNVVRWDPATGLVNTFIAAGAGIRAPKGMAFDAAGNLYICNADRSSTDTSPDQDQVLKFAGPAGGPTGEAPGTSLGSLVTSGSGGLDNPNHLVFHGTYLYVTNSRGDSINRYDAATGAFVDVFIAANSGGLNTPNYLIFRPDGYIYVSSLASSQVLRYNAASGAFVDVIVSAEHFATGGPLSIDFDSEGNLYVGTGTDDQVTRFAPQSLAVFTVTLNQPSALPVSIEFSTSDSTAIADYDYIGIQGSITFAPGQITRTIVTRAINDVDYEDSEVFFVNLSHPSLGALLIAGQGVATIEDDDPQPTKFYVVNDAATNLTYEYGDNGTALESYALNSGNAAPRGAASTTAGDKVWVVDANRTVYVYNAAGALLGSWTAGSIATNATVQGIATDGTDVWIVDAKSDKVFRYAGAATRLSGSQNAASSFSLNTGNRDPSDLVVRGSELWVVNNSSTDKVFKYSVSGALAGSWTISGGGGSPTGITVDPAGGTSLWIVDSSTDRVYQFDNATGVISGSLAPSTSFALAAGNTNPQGIADPPVSGGVAGEAGPISSLLLGTSLIDQLLASESELPVLGGNVDLSVVLATRRQAPQTDRAEIDQLDHWYAAFEAEHRQKPYRCAIEASLVLDAAIDCALPQR